MFPYWLLFAIFALGSFEQRGGAINAKMSATPLLTAAGLFAALMIGMRFEVGGDWFVYEELFDVMTRSSLANVIGFGDPGYGVLNWLVGLTGAEIWLVNLLCGLIFCWGLVKFARQQPNPWLAVLIAVPYLIIVVAMGYTRQAVAIGIILAGLSVVHNASIARFTIYIFLAVLFHKSALIILPLVALAAARQRIVVFPLLLGTAALLYYLFIQSSLDRLVAGYVEQEYQSQGAAIRVAMNLPPALIFLAFARRFQLAEQQHKLWRNFALAAIFALVILMFTNATTAVDRLALYLIPLQMFVLSRLPSAFGSGGRPSQGMLLLVIAYSAIIQFVWLNYATHAEYWLPYKVFPLLTGMEG